MVYTLSVHLYCNEDPESIPRLKAKLVEAARIYRKDRETIDWLVMQDVHDPRAFTIVERFENEAVSFITSGSHFGPVGQCWLKYTEPEIPPRKPILAYFWPLCHSPPLQAYGPAPPRGARYEQGCWGSRMIRNFHERAIRLRQLNSGPTVYDYRGMKVGRYKELATPKYNNSLF